MCMFKNVQKTYPIGSVWVWHPEITRYARQDHIVTLIERPCPSKYVEVRIHSDNTRFTVRLTSLIKRIK